MNLWISVYQNQGLEIVSLTFTILVENSRSTELVIRLIIVDRRDGTIQIYTVPF